MNEAVFAFDLDGTIITCEPRQQAVLAAVAHREGLSFDLQRVWRLKRAGASTLKALQDVGLDAGTAQRVAIQWRVLIEDAFWLQLDTTFDCAIGALTHLCADGAQCHLVTARSRPDLLTLQLRRLNLERFFCTVRVVDPAQGAKAKAFYLRSSRCAALFGDSEQDLVAAAQADVPFYAVVCGQRDAATLRSAGVRQTFEDLSEAVRAAVSHEK